MSRNRKVLKTNNGAFSSQPEISHRDIDEDDIFFHKSQKTTMPPNNQTLVDKPTSSTQPNDNSYEYLFQNVETRKTRSNKATSGNVLRQLAYDSSKLYKPKEIENKAPKGSLKRFKEIRKMIFQGKLDSIDEKKILQNIEKQWKHGNEDVVSESVLKDPNPEPSNQNIEKNKNQILKATRISGNQNNVSNVLHEKSLSLEAIKEIDTSNKEHKNNDWEVSKAQSVTLKEMVETNVTNQDNDQYNNTLDSKDINKSFINSSVELNEGQFDENTSLITNDRTTDTNEDIMIQNNPASNTLNATAEEEHIDNPSELVSKHTPEGIKSIDNEVILATTDVKNSNSSVTNIISELEISATTTNEQITVVHLNETLNGNLERNHEIEEKSNNILEQSTVSNHDCYFATKICEEILNESLDQSVNNAQSAVQTISDKSHANELPGEFLYESQFELSSSLLQKMDNEFLEVHEPTKRIPTDPISMKPAAVFKHAALSPIRTRANIRLDVTSRLNHQYDTMKSILVDIGKLNSTISRYRSCLLKKDK